MIAEQDSNILVTKSKPNLDTRKRKLHRKYVSTLMVNRQNTFSSALTQFLSSLLIWVYYIILTIPTIMETSIVIEVELYNRTENYLLQRKLLCR